MEEKEFDYSDIITATNDYRNSCTYLSKLMGIENHTNKLWKEKEMQVSKERWQDLQMNEITSAKYNAIIKHETFAEKLVYETAKINRKMEQIRNDSLKEGLYTTKKTLII